MSVFAVAAALMAVSPQGCKSVNYIQQVTVQPSTNLETLRLAVQMGPLLSLPLNFIFPVGEYGSVFMNPAIAGKVPFEFGFSLNIDALFKDPAMARADRTERLPDGQQIELGRAMAVIDPMPKPDPRFDVRLYVDILMGEWVGLALVIKDPNLALVPQDVMAMPVFQRNSESQATVFGKIFGRWKGPNPGDGYIEHNTIVVFAKVSELMNQSTQTLKELK